jgi:superfamily II DNA/RNA helicase
MVLLSATIDEQNGFEFYKKDIRDMIEKEYLCDYTIHVPIFNTDPTNSNIKEYLINHFRYIIVYCNSQKEGKEFNQLLNSDENLSDYIDCNTPKKKRNDILKRYKNGEIPFLVNVETLTEGFDAPITRGVLFLHLPSSQTKIIQVIGRALRLHPTKKLANVILPYSTSDDEKHISQFLKVLANNDKRIMKSYKNKKQGGYINITTNEEEEEDSKEDEVQFRYEQIYNSLGTCLLTVEEKIQALIELNRIPKFNEIYEYKNIMIKIGQFWHSLKHGTNKELYEKVLSKIKIFKDDYERLQTLKEEKQTKSSLTVKEKIEALIELNRIPKKKEIYEYKRIIFNIGIFWHKIKQGKNKEKYEQTLSKIKIFKNDYERLQTLKEEKQNNGTLTVEEKIQALIELNKIPKFSEMYEYKNISFKIGSFWDHIKQGCNKDKYEKVLSKIDIFKDDFERVQKLKEEKKQNK